MRIPRSRRFFCAPGRAHPFGGAAPRSVEHHDVELSEAVLYVDSDRSRVAVQREVRPTGADREAADAQSLDAWRQIRKAECDAAAGRIDLDAKARFNEHEDGRGSPGLRRARHGIARRRFAHAAPESAEQLRETARFEVGRSVE